jgi:ElaB/YqjD/DUF883 family membrane-anchored ribosome-binding protein
MKPEEIDQKRQELAQITEQLSELARREAKEISFAEAKKLKDRADTLAAELQAAFKEILTQ